MVTTAMALPFGTTGIIPASCTVFCGTRPRSGCRRAPRWVTPLAPQTWAPGSPRTAPTSGDRRGRSVRCVKSISGSSGSARSVVPRCGSSQTSVPGHDGYLQAARTRRSHREVYRTSTLWRATVVHRSPDGYGPPGTGPAPSTHDTNSHHRARTLETCADRQDRRARPRPRLRQRQRPSTVIGRGGLRCVRCVRCVVIWRDPGGQRARVARHGPAGRDRASRPGRPGRSRVVRSPRLRRRPARRTVGGRAPRRRPRCRLWGDGRGPSRRCGHLRGGRGQQASGGRDAPRRSAVHARAGRPQPRCRHLGHRRRARGDCRRRGVVALRTCVVPALGRAARRRLPRPAGPAGSRRAGGPAPRQGLRPPRCGTASPAACPSRRCASARCATRSHRGPCRSRRGSCPRSSRGRA